MLDKKKKDAIIKKFKTHKNDTGSSEVQIAILTEEVKELTEHLKEHKKDFSSRRGLIKKLNQRRKLLRFLERDNRESFFKLVKKLNIKVINVAEIAEEDQKKIDDDLAKEKENHEKAIEKEKEDKKKEDEGGDK
ncbi:30S ribosomal protein S15 [bacterium]|nr:30S ribosomal protein S15 [bacterium]